MTKKINVNHIKECLNLRFKPEQIARLGNNIIIYPSLNRKTYEKIIKTTCTRYISNIQKKFESCRYLNTDKTETLELLNSKEMKEAVKI